MKKLFTILAVLLCCKSFPQKFTLEDIARQVVKAVNKRDSKYLNPVLINYADYEKFYASYLSNVEKFKGKKQLEESAKYKHDTANLNSIKSAIKTTFISSLNFVRHNSHLVPFNTNKKFKYLTHSYTIDFTSTLYAPISSISIYATQGNSTFKIMSIICAATNNSWKMINIMEAELYKYPFADSSFNYWRLNKQIKKIEFLPVDLIENIWLSFKSQSFIENKDAILSFEEFKTIPLHALDIDRNYNSRYQQYIASITSNIYNDSLKTKINEIDYSKILIRYQIKNDQYAQLTTDLTFKIPFNFFYELYSCQLIFTNNKWKITSAYSSAIDNYLKLEIHNPNGGIYGLTENF